MTVEEAREQFPGCYVPDGATDIKHYVVSRPSQGRIEESFYLEYKNEDGQPVRVQYRPRRMKNR